MRPTHIEDFLVQLHGGQWFGWSDSTEKSYANLIIHDDTKSKPTELECNNGLTTLQNSYDRAITDTTNNIASAKVKLEALGLSVDEIKEAFGI